VYTKTYKTFKWNLGTLIVEIELKKKNAFLKTSKLSSMSKFIGWQSCFVVVEA
jgi:hypothetical protein